LLEARRYAARVNGCYAKCRAQFQGLSDGDHSFGGRNVDVEIGESIFVTLGLGCSF
jgi:hypothetical protein